MEAVYSLPVTVYSSRNVKEIVAKTRDFVNHHQRDLLLAVSLVLIAWSSYNLGKMQVAERTPVTVTRAQAQDITGTNGTGQAGERPALDPRVVVSKNSSSMKYHFSWCGSGKRIKEENRVWFETAADAEAAGYTLAGNCQ